MYFELLKFKITVKSLNQVAFLVVIAIVEPLTISMNSYQKAYFDRRINIWDWLIPIQQPIQIRGYSSREADAESQVRSSIEL